ncbi:MAG: hypothetical protein WCO54_08790 [Bacteroidota bacterium]
MKTQTILILAGLGIVGFYFYNKSKNKTNDTTTPPATTPNATKGRIVKKVVQKATAMQNFVKTK